ncbi:MAG: tetratricopeptide repeat protein [Actinobacteria bacterium]|nr:tetratricopeptide repeat protein [Actinomycetota bacterium]
MASNSEGRPESRVLWIPLLLLPLLVPIATTNTTLLGAEIPLTYDTLRLVKSVVVGVCALAAVVMWSRAARADGRAIVWPRAMWLLVAILGLATVSAAFSVNRPSAFFGSYDYRQGLIMIVVLASLLFLAVQLRGDGWGARALASAVVIGSIPVAIYGLLQVFGLGFGDWGAPEWAIARGFSTLGNPDNYGGYLVFPVALAFGLAMSEERIRLRLAWWAAFGVVSVSVLLTQVRGAWLGVLAAGVVGVVFLVRRRVKFRHEDLVALAVAIVVLAGAGVWAGDSIQQRVADMFSGESDAGSGRMALWATGIRAAAERPLLGNGPDSFRFGYYMARGTDHEVLGGYRTVADDAHSLPIMVAVTLGVPALLVALAFAASVFSGSGSVLFDRDSKRASTVEGAWFAAVIGHLVYLCFGPSSITTNLLLALGTGILLGLAAGAEKELDAGWVRWIGGGLAAIAAALVLTSSLSMVADHAFMRALNSEGDEAVSAAESAIARSPWTYRYRALRAGLLGEAARHASAEGLLDAAEAVVVAYEDLARFSPAEYQAYVGYASTMLDLTDLEDRGARVALDAAVRGIDVYPSGLEARTYGAVACLRLGSPEDAVTLLKDDWNTDPKYADPMVMYAFALIGTGDPDGASAVVDTLEETNPDDERIERLREAIGEARSQTQ